MLRKFKMGGVILGALLALVGCQSEKLVNDGGSQQGQQFTLTASRGVQSRTHLGDPFIDDTGKKILPMYWSEGDEIYVSSLDGKTTGRLKLQEDGVGKSSATFSGFVFGNPDNLYYSVYPVPVDGKVDLSTLTGREVRTPMVGTVKTSIVGNTQSKSVAFDNTCGMMVVEGLGIDADDDISTSFKLYAGTSSANLIPLAATAQIAKDANGNVIVDAEGNVSLDYTSKENINFIELDYAEFIEGKLYIPYDLQSNINATGIHFFMKSDANASLEQITSSTIDLNAAVIGKPLYAGAKILVDNNGVATTVLNKEIPTESITEGSATVEVGATENAVNIPSIPEAVSEVTIEMPITLEGDKNKAIVAIEEIKNEDAKITITSASQEVSQIENLTVILPSGTTEEEVADKVVIEMPNTTVTVKSADGNVLIINEMTASTAPNTLVVEKDVVIKKLNLQKGSLQVFGHIDHLVVSENKENVLYIIIEVGGSIGKITGNDGYQLIDKNKIDEIIIIPNPALSQYLYDKLGSAKVTINPNTQYAEMKKSDVVTVNEIVIDNDNNDGTDYTITSLVGIENFVNLSKLVCINVGLEEADLSQNLNLKEICCNFNEELASLILPEVEMSSIEVSNCTELESLNIEYPNSIVTLDYSHTNVSFTDDQLAEFTSMKKLGCAGRFNGTLNIPNSIKGNLETLICQNNALTALNLAEYPNLQVLQCYWNELTSLDLASAPNLVVLRCFENQMTELDITPLNNLKMLDCGNQQNGKTLNLLVSDSEDLARWEEHVNTRTDYNQDVEVCIVIKNHELSLAIWAEIQKDELILPGQVYLNGDNWLVMSRDAVDAVTVLNFNRDENYTISSLSGIEHFTNLTRLVCEETGLIKAADLSSNTALTYLDVSFNGGLTSLNIDGLVNLTALKYSETAITSLAIPEEAIPNIETLCYGRQPYIDNPVAVYVPNINEFTSLTELACYGQKFTLTNPAIKAQLIDLQCYMCNMSELNLTEYSSLIGLTCYANNLTELVIPENSQITSLYCYGNKLTTLDVTPLEDKLNYLWCGAQESELLLKLTESQKNRWNDPENGWYIDADINKDGNGLNSNVELSVDGQQGGSDVTNGNTGGSGFTNGGIF